jgi:hypothetical protein
VLHLMSQSDAAAAVETQRLADVDKDQSISNAQCVSSVRLTSCCYEVANNTSEKKCYQH